MAFLITMLFGIITTSILALIAWLVYCFTSKFVIFVIAFVVVLFFGSITCDVFDIYRKYDTYVYNKKKKKGID